MKSSMISLFLVPQTYKMPWDSWMKSTKSFLFCFHGGLLWRGGLLMLVATAMEGSIPIYYWVSGCVVFRYPEKNFLHDELSSLRFEGFEDVSGGGCTVVCVDTLLNTCQLSASDWAGCFAESFWKENWSQRSVWTLGMMAERNKPNFYGVPSYRSQKAIGKHWGNVREKRGNMVHPAPKACVKNYIAQMAEIIFTFIAHVVWF